jgi:5-formyltetrahydrofolate cyclo-ligase
MIDQREHKKALRAQLREMMQGIDVHELRDKSDAAAARLFGTVEFDEATTIMIFLSIPNEIDTCPIAMRAWQTRKTVTVPLVSFEQRHMIPVELKSLNDPMETGRLGVRHPTNGQPIPVDDIDLVVVPGLGFDLEGHRLGRGAGFYDRFLSQPSFNGTACALAIDEQVVDLIPAMNHDVAVEMLVTDKRLVRFGKVRNRG